MISNAHTRGYFKKLLFHLLFVTIFLIISLILSSFLFLNKSTKLNANSKSKLSYYEDTEFDFIINDLCEDQYLELTHDNNVKRVIKYQVLNYNASIKDKEAEFNLIILQNSEDIEMTEFNSKRIIRSLNKVKNEIYIDEKINKNYEIDLGDKIKVLGTEYTITRIYYSSPEQSMYIPNFCDNLLELIGSPFKMSGVYVDCENLENFTNDYLINYKPLGILKNRSEFTTDDAYQQYLNEFNSKDYSSSYLVKNNNYENDIKLIKNAQKDSNNCVLFSGLISGSFIFISYIVYVLLNKKRLNTEIVNNGSKEVKKRNITAMLSLLVISLLVYLLLAFILTSKTYNNINYLNVFINNILILSIQYIFIFISFFVTYLLTLKNERRKVN